MIRCSLLLSFLLLAACSSDTKTDRDERSSASYRVDFVSVWSGDNFPVNFPSNAHFSGLVGATHNEQIIFWQAGQLATPGIESVAETGNKAAFINEIETAKTAGLAEYLLSGDGISSSPSMVSLEFDINENHPLVTLVSMLAPSPDWFVGVRNLNLFDSQTNDWKQTQSIDLVLYDSGTDNGSQFKSSNDNAIPASIISSLTSLASDTDFVNGVHNTTELHMATMIFTRTK